MPKNKPVKLTKEQARWRDWLQEQLVASGLNQQQIADLSGYDKTSISLWNTGSRPMSAKAVRTIARSMNFSLPDGMKTLPSTTPPVDGREQNLQSLSEKFDALAEQVRLQTQMLSLLVERLARTPPDHDK